MRIPDSVSSVSIRRDVPGLCRTGPPSGAYRTIEEIGYDPIAEGTTLGLAQDTFVEVGRQIGEGRQGRVYEVATCPGACLKLRKNDRAAKQFRRELLGYPHYARLNVACPEVLGADGEGRWILKSRWPDDLRSGIKLLEEHGRMLPPDCVRLLRGYAHRFEDEGLCVDGLPSNVLFMPHACGSYETTLWPSSPEGSWTFASCFLLMWLPEVIPQVSGDSWPPFRLPRDLIDRLRVSWLTGPFDPWRESFGDFPDLCPEWWEVV